MIIGLMFILGHYNLLMLYSSTLFIVSGLTIKVDSFSAIMKKHLHENSFKKAVSVNYATVSGSSIMGTLLGGMSIVYLTDFFNYILIIIASLSLILSIPVHETFNKNESSKSSTRNEIRSIGSFLLKITGFLILAFFINGLLISMDTYSAGLFNLVLRASPIYYTPFNMSFPIGQIAGTPMASTGYFKDDKPIVIAMLMFVFCPMVAIIAIGRSPLMDIIDAFIMGFVLPIINIPINTKLMQAIPQAIYGRVMAFIKIFASGSTPALGVLFSAVSIFFSIPTVLIWVSILTVPLAIYATIAIPKFFNIASRDVHEKESV